MTELRPIEKIMCGMDSIQFTNLSREAKRSVNDINPHYYRFSTLLYDGSEGGYSFHQFLESRNIPHSFVMDYKPQQKRKVPCLQMLFPDYRIKIGLNPPFALTIRFCLNKFVNKTRHNLILRNCNLNDLYLAMQNLISSFEELLIEFRDTLTVKTDHDIFSWEMQRWQGNNFTLGRLDFTCDIYFKESQYKQEFLKQVSEVRIPDYSRGNIDDVSITFLPSSVQQEKSIPRIKIYDKHGDVLKHYPDCEDAIKQSKNVVRFEFQMRRSAIRKRFGGLAFDRMQSANVESIFKEYFNSLFIEFFKVASFDEKKVIQLMRSYKYFRAFAKTRSVHGVCESLRIKKSSVYRHIGILADLGLIAVNKKKEWAQLTDVGLQFCELFVDEKKDLTHIDVISFIGKSVSANLSRKVRREQTIFNSLNRMYDYDILYTNNIFYNSIDRDQSRNTTFQGSMEKSVSIAASLKELILGWLKNMPDGVPEYEIIEKFGQKAEAVITELLDKGEAYEQRPGVLKLM